MMCINAATTLETNAMKLDMTTQHREGVLLLCSNVMDVVISFGWPGAKMLDPGRLGMPVN